MLDNNCASFPWIIDGLCIEENPHKFIKLVMVVICEFELLQWHHNFIFQNMHKELFFATYTKIPLQIKKG